MNKLIVLIGIAGSGKSTYAKQLVRESRGKIIRVNRDDLRGMLFGLEDDHSSYYASPNIKNNEKTVSNISNHIINYCRNFEIPCVVDNTSLKISYINKFIELWGNNPIIIKVIDTPLEECIRRDKNRDRTVGEDVIRKQYKQLQNLLSNPEFISLQEKYK